LLLYVVDLQEIIGKQLRSGDILLFYKDISIHEHDTVHFCIHMPRDKNHITTRAFEYAQANGLLEDYFALIAIIAKGAVKLGYKKGKKEMFTHTEIILEDRQESLRLNPSIYEFHEGAFLQRKLNKELNMHPHIKAL